MAVSVLALQSEDKLVRQAYQRRKDEIFFYNKSLIERDAYKHKVEQAMQKVKHEAQRANQEAQRAKQETMRANQEAQRANQAERQLADKDAIIAELMAKLASK